MTEQAPADDVARPEMDEAAADEADAPPPKKRKKKRRAGPGFARRFPRDAELDRLVDAFDRGDYATVREGAARLAKSAEREAVRRAAQELRRRVDPDPLAVVLLLAAIGLLAFLALWYWSHGYSLP